MSRFSLTPEEGEDVNVESIPSATEYLSVLVGMLLFIGVVCLVAGGLYLTKITAGVGGIAAACFFGIVARIVQAHIHHKT